MPTALEDFLIEKDKTLVKRLPYLGVGLTHEVLPSFGVCRAVEVSLGCKIYLHAGYPYIVGVRGWFDGGLATFVRLPESRKFKRVFEGPPILANMVATILERDVIVELYREWTKVELEALYDRMAVLVTDGEAEFYHVPFWKRDAAHKLGSPDELSTDKSAEEQARRIPFQYIKTKTYLHLGELLTDNYGILWEVVGCDIETTPPMISVRHTETNAVLTMLPSAFANVFRYKPLPKVSSGSGTGVTQWGAQRPAWGV